MSKTLHEFIESKRSESSSSPAFLYNGVSISYRTFFQLVDNAERHLAAAGVKAGSFVGTTIGSSVVFLCAMLALSRRSAAIVPIDATGSDDFKRQAISRHQIRVAITDAKHREKLESAGCHVIDADDLVRSAAPSGSWPGSIILDPQTLPCFVGFSSGTTGMPKSAVFSARAILERVEKAERFATNDRLLLAFAPTSAFGAVYALRILADRATLAFSATPGEQALIDTIEAIQPTHLVATPAILSNLHLIMKDRNSESYDCFRSLKSVVVGGSSISPIIVEWIRSQVCPHLMSLYGSTEDGRIATADQDLLLSRAGIAGRLLPFIRAEVVGPDELPLAEGQTGRLRFKTPYPAERLIGGQSDIVLNADTWSYPGDLGRIMGDELYVVGRVDDIINLGGIKVDPADIESELCKRLGVREAAVVPFSDPISGSEQLGALVVDDDSRSADLLRERFNADFPIALHCLFVVEALPKNERGKLMRTSASNQFNGLLKA